MDFIDEIKALSSKIAKQAEMIQTEEATKNAFIMPFISALGYNVFDPTEVTPELDADIGVKKGEKVDYAILRDGKPVMLFECKSCKTNLDQENITQLYRYFNATEARFGILTNGILYRFYTDLEESNKMDKKPFLELNLLELKDAVIDDLKRFCKSAFNLEETLTAAAELKYTREMKRILSDQFTNPSEEFVRFFAAQVYSGKLTQAVKQQFTDLTKRALNQFIADRINERLKSALADEPASVPATPSPSEPPQEEAESKIVTTQEELEGFYMIKAILRQHIDVSRIVMRDTMSYCGILLDDNNRKPICRLYFNSLKKKYLGLFDAGKKEEKIAIEDVNEIYRYAERLQMAVQFYEQNLQQ
ncbi:MAG: type I restriction enzyme HsdR N-terminal domain-containing protein [Candidatus Babeliaceae bacterium]|nr:type I restriction enzyme HsdR N-terminal domain-containing protein [Candidatus Babeliaceae bacterium]